MFPFPSMLCAIGRSRTTTWNPSDKGAGIDLSNGNLTASANSTANSSVRATTSLSTGLRAVRFTATAVNSDLRVGFCNSSLTVGSTILGGDNNGVGFDAQSGQVLLNGASLSSPFTLANGDVVDIAINIGTKKLWLRKNGGAWTGDPVAGTGAIDLSSMAAGPYFPAVGVPSAAGRIATAEFYLITLPPGLVAWDE